MLPYKEEVKKAIDRVIERGQYIYGEEIKAFEQEWATYNNQRYAVGVGSGTDAIRIALLALGIGPGDEVISPAFNVAYTSQAVASIGAVNVFCDVDEYGVMNPWTLEDKYITSKTKAIIPVHLFGRTVTMDDLWEIAKTHNILIVEDAAQAHGGKFGKYSHAVAYSHYPTKNLGALGEAGSITTDLPIVSERAKLIRDAGRTNRYTHVLPGVNSCLDEIQAAVLRTKLPHLDNRNMMRRNAAQYYSKCLEGIVDISINLRSWGVFHLYVICLDKRNELHSFLTKKGIPSLIHYPLIVPHQPVFINELAKESWPNSTELSNTVLSLPLHPDITQEDQDIVINAIKEFYEFN